MEANTSKRKITFVYNIDNEIYWQDGLREALRLLENDFDIDYFNLATAKSSVPVYKDSVILVWGAFDSLQSKIVATAQFHPSVKKAICFAGGAINHPLAHKYDLIFVEEEWTMREFKKIGIKTKLAFGTNTKLFKPMDLPKRWDCIYPAAFALWKRHDKFVEYVKGKKALAVGYMQPNGHERECYEICLKNGIDVLPRVTPDVLVYLYNMSKEVVVTADVYGGGQRTILEALACGIKVNKSLLNERLLSVYEGGLLTEVDYYKSLKEGLCELV